MSARKARWSKVYESSEEELLAFLDARRIATLRQTAAELEQLPQRQLSKDMTIYLAEGSASLNADSNVYALQPGDYIALSRGTTVSGTAGISGCVWYETT